MLKNTNTQSCNTCLDKPNYQYNYTKTKCAYTGNGCSTKWIDSAMLEYKFGRDYCDGQARDRWIPGWLVEFCLEETGPQDLGYPDPCEKDVYYKIIGGLVYRVKYDCNGNEESRTYIKKAKIQDCAIEGLDASKIINRCKFFQNTTLVKPIDTYMGEFNGVRTINPNFQFLDITLTDDCQLKAVFESRIARRAVLPALQCLVDYDIVNDTAKVNLANLVDNETVRVIRKTGECDRLFSYTYATDNIEGEGTREKPLIAKVKVTDNIEGNGTTTAPLKAVIKTKGPVIGNGTTENPVTIDKCAGLPVSYLSQDNGFYFLSIDPNSVTPVLRTQNYPAPGERSTWLTFEVPFSIQIPETGCPDKVWFAHAIATWDNVTNNVSVPTMFSSNVDFLNEGVQVYFNAPNPFFPDAIRSIRLENSWSTGIETSPISDSTGHHRKGNSYMVIPGGITLNGKFFFHVTFPNGTNYNSVKTSFYMNGNIPFSHWFTRGTLQIALHSLKTK